jgi:hypothetical protein
MPRVMPPFDAYMMQEAQVALGLAKAGEIARTGSTVGSPPWKEWRVSRLEALYELAYLRVFIAWETFLEISFYRYLCGHSSLKYGQATPVSGSYYPNVATAESAVLGTNTYLLWHNPGVVIARCQHHITTGRHETVCAANQAKLRQFGCIRHRIAHGQDDAKHKFDAVTRLLVGHSYPGSRPGRFLRDWVHGSTPPVRWLEAIIADFGLLAGQIV